MSTAMKRPEKGSGDFEPCPAGMQQMVLVDIVDCGWKLKDFDGRPKGHQPEIKLVFASSHLREDGLPYCVFDRGMKWSFHEKSALYDRLSTWLGKARIESMLDNGVELETLLGENALINVEHVESNGKMFANVGSIAPLMAGMVPLSYPQFERMNCRDSWIEPVPSAFCDPVTARRILGEVAGQGTLPAAAPQAAQLPTTPAPVAPPVVNTTPLPVTTPPAVAAAVTPAAPQFGPMTANQMNGLIGLGTRLFGAAVTTELEARSQKLFTKSWIGLTTDEASRLTFELRNIKPIEAVAIKNAATPAATMQYDEAVYMSEPYSPFADEGTPGWRPDGHVDILKDREQNAALAAEIAAAQPALIPDTAQATAQTL